MREFTYIERIWQRAFGAQILKFQNLGLQNQALRILKAQILRKRLLKWQFPKPQILKKTQILGGVLGAMLPLYAVDYSERLPGSITLNGGDNEISNAIATCRDKRGCMFGYNWGAGGGGFNINYSTIGSGSSSLTLNGSVPQTNNYGFDKTLFYIHSLNIGSNSNLTLNNFHSVGFDGAITLGANSSLKITLQKGQSYPQSEWGALSQIDLSTNASIHLLEGSLLEVSNGDSFDSNAAIDIEKGARFNVETTNLYFYTSLTNKGEVNLQGEVWAVGQKITYLNFPATTTITNYGTMNIAGDFHNGGILNPNDPDAAGGGRLINYGGSINITGTLSSQSKGGQSSSIQIYGGTLKTTGGIDNDANSTIIIGAYNGQLGQIESDITNDGTIKVDLTGAGLGSFELIKGQITGTNTNIEISSNGSDFITSSMQGGTITISKDDAKIKAFNASLEGNSAAIINALDESLFIPNAANPQTIYTYGGASYLRSLSQDIESSAQSLIAHAAPLGVWSMLQEAKAQLSATPPYYTLPRATKPGKQVFGNATLGLVPDSKIGFSLTPFASSSSIQALKGTYMGVNAALSYTTATNTAQLFATYATATPSQSLAHAANDFKSSQFLFGFYDRLSLNGFEASLLLHYGSSSLRSSRSSDLSATALSAALAYNELGAELIFAAPLHLSEKIMLKPLIGTRYVLAHHGAFSESNGTALAPALSAKAQQTHLLQAIAGLEGRYYFGAKHFLYGGAQLLHALTPDSQMSATLGSQELVFMLKNQRAYSLYLGGSAPLSGSVYLKAQALYGVSERAFSTLSGSLGLSYLF